MPELPDPVTYAVPAFILLLIAEMIVSLRRDTSRYEARDTLTSLRAITRQLESRPADYLLGLEPVKEFAP